MNKYDLARSKFLILISVLITFSLLYLFTYIRGLELLTINSNNYMTHKSREFSITIKSDSVVNEVKETIKKMKVVSLKNNEGLTKFYFNKNSLYGPKIVWLKDANKTENNDILLGEELFKVFQKSGEKKYEILIKDISVYCNVVGVIESSEYDFKEYSEYVLLDIEDITTDDLNGLYRVNGDVSLFASNLDIDGIYLEEEEMNLLALSGGRFLSVQFIFFVILCLLFTFIMVLISRIWFGHYLKEAVIRIVHGAGKYNILLKVFLKYISAQVSGILIGFILFYGYFKIINSDLELVFLVRSLFFGLSAVFGINLTLIVVNYLIFLSKSFRSTLES
jgi:hypothetical protein